MYDSLMLNSLMLNSLMLSFYGILLQNFCRTPPPKKGSFSTFFVRCNLEKRGPATPLMARWTLARMPVLDIHTGTMGRSRSRAILLVHMTTLRELEPSPRAQGQLGWPTFHGAPRKPLTGARITFWVLGLFAQWEPVRGRFGRSLWGSRGI